ncbi:MAG: hypothetical protein MUE73_04840 [Planctomycetes bacterium]|nr:hypothetical protein [Planctomycetota bacterium]
MAEFLSWLTERPVMVAQGYSSLMPETSAMWAAGCFRVKTRTCSEKPSFAQVAMNFSSFSAAAT